jgi:hypothetical protein
MRPSVDAAPDASWRESDIAQIVVLDGVGRTLA